MSPIQSAFPGIQVGSVNISYFGLIVVAAVLAGGVTLWRSAPRVDDSIDAIVELIIMSFVSALVLGRLAYVLAPPPSVEVLYSREWYLSHISDLLVGPLAIWSGGLDAGGMLLGTLVGARVVMWRRQMPFVEWANAISVGLVIFLALAPLANLVNSQQIGPPTNLPWGVPLEHRFGLIDDLTLYPIETRFHPTPGYVSLWAVMVLFLLPTIAKWRAFRSDNYTQYILRGLFLLPGLFAAEFLRMDISRPILGLTLLQCVAVALWLALVAQNLSKRPITKTTVPSV